MSHAATLSDDTLPMPAIEVDRPPERRPALAPPPGLDTGSGHVLVVDDDPAQARYARAVLEAADYRVSVCDDPRLFLHHVATGRPDLVLMDVVLPGASGYELVRCLRHDPAAADLPVLFLTGEGEMPARL